MGHPERPVSLAISCCFRTGTPARAATGAVGEQYASSSALERIYMELTSGSSLSPSRRTAEEIVEQARQSDAAALSALTEVARHLGRGLVNLIMALNPEEIIVGDYIAEAWDFNRTSPARNDPRSRPGLFSDRIAYSSIERWTGRVREGRNRSGPVQCVHGSGGQGTQTVDSGRLGERLTGMPQQDNFSHRTNALSGAYGAGGESCESCSFLQFWRQHFVFPHHCYRNRFRAACSALLPTHQEHLLLAQR